MTSCSQAEPGLSDLPRPEWTHVGNGDVSVNIFVMISFRFWALQNDSGFSECLAFLCNFINDLSFSNSPWGIPVTHQNTDQ